jgi:hypothetical protein
MNQAKNAPGVRQVPKSCVSSRLVSTNFSASNTPSRDASRSRNIADCSWVIKTAMKLRKQRAATQFSRPDLQPRWPAHPVKPNQSKPVAVGEWASHGRLPYLPRRRGRGSRRDRVGCRPKESYCVLPIVAAAPPIAAFAALFRRSRTGPQQPRLVQCNHVTCRSKGTRGLRRNQCPMKGHNPKRKRSSALSYRTARVTSLLGRLR